MYISVSNAMYCLFQKRSENVEENKNDSVKEDDTNMCLKFEDHFSDDVLECHLEEDDLSSKNINIVENKEALNNEKKLKKVKVRSKLKTGRKRKNINKVMRKKSRKEVNSDEVFVKFVQKHIQVEDRCVGTR